MEPLPLRERNKQKVIQRIITAAVELFKAQGYAQTTIDDIAAEAEISRRTLFNYFPSKEALLLPWAREILDGHLKPAVNAHLQTEPTTMDAIHLFFTLISEAIATSPDVVQAFLYESLHAADAPHETLGSGVREVLAQLMRYGQARSEIRADITAEQLAFYVSALLTPLLFNLFTPTAPPNMLDLDTLLGFIGTGLSPVPGSS